MDTFEVESYVRGRSLCNYIINARFICVELIFVKLNLAILPKICQFTKLKTSQKFSAMW